jgi:hypothetical protein
MQLNFFNPNAQKKPTNLSINSEYSCKPKSIILIYHRH